ncbi:hypothetical protein XCR_2998 [Xanthomonas campestris pv. raphani 756C]|nr:hypothetical protein XCR_2998 [Xanthomonas campestris pv. raphani 756C]
MQAGLIAVCAIAAPAFPTHRMPSCNTTHRTPLQGDAK